MKDETMIRKKVSGGPTKIRLRSKSPAGIEHCPGCHYGIIMRVVTEVIEELGLEDRTFCMVDIGCITSWGRASGFHFIYCPHGRSFVAGVGVKRALPDAIVFNIIGDGGLAAIGMGHFMSCMVRSEKITTIFMNNAGYGMTGGQMAPTTLLGLKTTTTPYGRNPQTQGFPVHVSELAAGMKGTACSHRVSVHTPANFQRSKKAVRNAFEKQVNGVGYGIVEFLSACPTDWGLNPSECLKFIDEKMIAEYPLGEFKNVDHIDYLVDPEVEKIGRIRRR